MKKIYLDHAAATPLDAKVMDVMRPYFSEDFYNPSALYLAAKDVLKDMTEAYASVAKHLGTNKSGIVFTAGGTEANNLVIHGVMQMEPGTNIVVSAVEHESVLEPAKLYERRIAPVLPDGRIDLEKLEKLIDDKTALVSVMYANNEIGTIQPIKQIAHIIHKLQKRRSNSSDSIPIYFHTDASQAAAYLDLHVSRLGVDFMTLNGGKIYGPKQTGVMYARPGVDMNTLILGGSQQWGRRSGTENVPGSIGFAKALELVQEDRHEESKRLEQLQDEFIHLLALEIPSAQINGSMKHRLPGNVHVTIPGQDNERLIMALDEAGILAAAGSACSASNDEPSHVLKAIGLSDEDARASLRFTMGKSTDEKAVHRTVDTLAKLVA